MYSNSTFRLLKIKKKKKNGKIWKKRKKDEDMEKIEVEKVT
jgi:hypothetical protein